MRPWLYALGNPDGWTKVEGTKGSSKYQHGSFQEAAERQWPDITAVAMRSVSKLLP